MTDTATNEAVINLTASAVAEVKVLLAKPENAAKFLRVYVEQGGCSGMSYGMVFDEKRADSPCPCIGARHRLMHQSI